MTVNDSYFPCQKVDKTEARRVAERRLILVHCTNQRAVSAGIMKATLTRLLDAKRLREAAEQPEISELQERIEAAQLRREAESRREIEEIWRAMDSQIRELERTRATHEASLRERDCERSMPAWLSLQARHALTEQHERAVRLMERWHRIRTITLLVIVDVGFLLCLGMLQGIANKVWVIAGMIAAAIAGGFVMSNLIRSLDVNRMDEGEARSDRTVSSWLEQLFPPSSSHQS